MVIRLRPCMIMSIAPPRAGEGGPLEAAPEAIKIRVLLCFASQSGLNTTCTVGGCGQHRKEHGKNQEKVHGRCGDDGTMFIIYFFAQALVSTLMFNVISSRPPLGRGELIHRGRGLPSSLFLPELHFHRLPYVSHYGVLIGRTQYQIYWQHLLAGSICR